MYHTTAVLAVFLSAAYVLPTSGERIQECKVTSRGSEFRDVCNWCSCGGSGKPACTRRRCEPDFENRAIEQGMPDCRGDAKWKDGCSWCHCEDGYKVCTGDACEGPPKPKIEVTEIECELGSSWKETCNECECGAEGLKSCTKMRCRPGHVVELPECSDGSRWKEECNWCSCNEGRKSCTKRGCLPKEAPKSSGNTGFSNVSPVSTNQEPPPIPCEEGTQWMNKCNACRCINGLTLCTHKKCETSEKSHLALSRDNCVIDSRWRQDCNWCYCTVEQNSVCTFAKCDPDEVYEGSDCEDGSMWRTDTCQWCRCTNGTQKCQPSECKVKYTEVVEKGLNFEKHCEPGSKWKKDCNWCHCLNNGFGICELMGCLGGEEIEGAKVCEYGSRWKRDSCNWCNCTGEGQAECTEMVCGDETCTEGDTWIDYCRECVCLNGQAKCTPIPCTTVKQKLDKIKRPTCVENAVWREGCNICHCLNNIIACTSQNCQNTSLPALCQLPAVQPEAPICEAAIHMWTFNIRSKKCEEVVYGGCSGTDNLFATEEQCTNACAPTEITYPIIKAKGSQLKDNCLLLVDKGQCSESVKRFAFVQDRNRCEPFQYNGCQGNLNNFLTAQDCYNLCGGNPPLLDPSCDRSKCNWNRFGHYFARNCNPIYEEGACCPTKFICKSETEQGMQNDKCYYRGVEYDDGDAVPVQHKCSARCMCRVRQPHSLAEIICANIECPNLFNRPPPNCRLLYSEDKCCSVDRECEDPNNPLLTIEERTDKCTFGNQTWLFGDQMDFDDFPCRTCICSPEFTDTSGPGCRAIDCGFEFRYRSHMVDGCAPIYFENNCCSVGWLCPDDGSLVNPEKYKTEALEPTKESHCRLGHLLIPVEAHVEVNDCHVDCNCITPPELTCVRSRSCTSIRTQEDVCQAQSCAPDCESAVDSGTGCPICTCNDLEFHCPKPVCPPNCDSPEIIFEEETGCKKCQCKCFNRMDCPMDCAVINVFDKDIGCKKCICNPRFGHINPFFSMRDSAYNPPDPSCRIDPITLQPPCPLDCIVTFTNNEQGCKVCKCNNQYYEISDHTMKEWQISQKSECLKDPATGKPPCPQGCIVKYGFDFESECDVCSCDDSVPQAKPDQSGCPQEQCPADCRIEVDTITGCKICTCA